MVKPWRSRSVGGTRIGIDLDTADGSDVTLTVGSVDILLDPATAREMARALVAHADDAERAQQ